MENRLPGLCNANVRTDNKLSGADCGQDNSLTELRRCVRDRLRSGVYKLATDRRGRSKVWEHFRMVLDEGGSLVGYAGCMYCLDVLKHDPHLSGTSSLFCHLRSCPAAGILSTEGINVPEVHVKEEEPRNHEEWDIFSQTTDVCAEFVVLDMLSYHTIRGEGFKKLAQFLVECGALHGKFDVESVLPQPSTLAEWVCERAEGARLELRKVLNTRLVHGAAVALHTLTHCGSSPFVALTVHYIRDWSIEADFLGVCEFRGDICKKVKNEVLHCLKKFGIALTPEKLAVTTSVEGMVRESWSEACRLNSFTYMINLSVNQLLRKSETTKEICKHLDKFKDFVGFINETDEKLSKQLRIDSSERETDWIDIIEMAERLCNMQSELQTVQQRELQETLSKESEKQLRQLIKLLSPFKSAVGDMESWEAPTLHKVMPWLTHLRDSCSADPSDSEDLVALKEAMRLSLDVNVEVHLLHKVAVFFNPRMNSLRILSTEDREAVRKEVTRIAQGHIDIIEPPKKRYKQGNSPLAYLEDANHEQDDCAAEREIQLYTIMKDYTDSENLLVWWQRNSSMLPLLSTVARRVLAIPASTTPTTHLLQIATKVQDLRLWTKKLNTDDLIFLHSRLSQTVADHL